MGCNIHSDFFLKDLRISGNPFLTGCIAAYIGRRKILYCLDTYFRSLPDCIVMYHTKAYDISGLQLIEKIYTKVNE